MLVVRRHIMRALVLLFTSLALGCSWRPRTLPATDTLWSGYDKYIEVTALDADALGQLKLDNPQSAVVTSADGSRKFISVKKELITSMPVKIALTPISVTIDGVAYSVYAVMLAASGARR